MTSAAELTDAELDDLDRALSLVVGGKIPNFEALDGFFAALACCPDLVMPSEYMPIIQNGETEDGDMVFDDLGDARRFMDLVSQHWNYVHYQLNESPVYFPLLREDETGAYGGNDWANGFLCGINMRHGIWSELINSEEHGGSMVPIWALAYEHHPEADMRPYTLPIDEKKREELIIGAAAGVMRMHAYYRRQGREYAAQTETFVRPHRKIGRNEPCPCGSGKKYKRCCGRGPTVH
ncbi:MAG: UPF0149 family protein [Proteobacteria bacterium]|nr:UPF0149 family protein [Pseudomonadota bacterium]